jgi:pyridoxal biosynthesis lyase PdxS
MNIDMVPGTNNLAEALKITAERALHLRRQSYVKATNVSYEVKSETDLIKQMCDICENVNECIYVASFIASCRQQFTVVRTLKQQLEIANFNF